MVRLHRVLALAALLLSLPLIMAMGFGDSEAPTRIPEPKVNYLVTLTDQGGTTVELTHFSIEGVGFISGEMGRGDLAVPLEKVKSVEIRRLDSELKATVSMSDGKTVRVSIKGDLKATGKTAFGNYRIPLDQVSSLVIKGIGR